MDDFWDVPEPQQTQTPQSQKSDDDFWDIPEPKSIVPKRELVDLSLDGGGVPLNAPADEDTTRKNLLGMLDESIKRDLLPPKLPPKLEEAKKRHLEEGEQGGMYLAERTPFVRSMAGGAYYKRLYDAAKEIEGGEASDKAWDVVGEHLANQEREKNKGFLRKTFDVGSGLPAFGIELALTGGSANAAKALAEKAVGRVVSGTVGRIATKAAGAMAEGLAQAAMHPDILAARAMQTTAEKAVQGEEPDFIREAVKAGVNNFLEFSAFSAVGGPPGLPTRQRGIVEGAAKGMAAIEGAQLAENVAGTAEGPSKLMRLAQGDPTALKDLAAEFAGFMGGEAAMKAGQQITRQLAPLIKDGSIDTSKATQIVQDILAESAQSVFEQKPQGQRASFPIKMRKGEETAQPAIETLLEMMRGQERKSGGVPNAEPLEPSRELAITHPGEKAVLPIQPEQKPIELVGSQGQPAFAGIPLRITALENLLNKGLPIGPTAKKWLTSAGSLPKEVFAEKVAMEGRIAAYAQDVRNTERDLKKAVGNIARVPEPMLKQMNDALGGDQAAMSALPPEPARVVQNMRDQIDVLSRALIQSGAIDSNMIPIVDANLGVYLNRAYRVFNDPTWAQKVDPAVRNRFKTWLEAERTAAGIASTPEQLESITNSLLYEGKAAETPIAFLSKSKLGSKDLSILTKRKDVPPELRALWGEYEHPLINYANSIGKMASLLSNHVFLTEVRNKGLGQYLFAEPTGKAITRIATEGSEVMKPLNGLYTTPEIKQAFEDIYSPKATSMLAQIYMSGLALAKYAKTIGSHVTHIGNFVGNNGFAVANGHWRVDKALPAVKMLATDTPQSRARHRRLTELGVIGDNVNAGEFRDLVKDVLGQRDEFLGAAMNLVTDKQIGGWMRRGAELGQKVYHAEDAVWKAYAFENEAARYRKAYPQWTTEQVEQRAADIVRNTYPTYSMVPKVVRGMRRLPFGPFISFPAEVARTAFHSLKLATQELATPETRSIGAQRLLGLATAATLSSGLAMMTRAMFGIDKKDEEAMRRFMPEWSVDSPVVHLGQNEKGDYRYIDMQKIDPHTYLKEPIIAALRGDDVGEAIRNAVKAAARPFASEELAAKGVFDLVRNKTATGSPVYNPQASPSERTLQIGQHLGEPFVPGSVTSGRRLMKAMAGTPEPKTGRQYDVGEELTANLTGQRIQSIKLDESLGFKVRAFERNDQDVRRLLNDTVKRKDMVSDKEVADAYTSMERARRKLFEEMRQDVLAAQKLGMTREQVARKLKDSGMSEQDRMLILQGRYIPFRPTMPFLKSGWETMRNHVAPEEWRRRMNILDLRSRQESGSTTAP